MIEETTMLIFDTTQKTKNNQHSNTQKKKSTPDKIVIHGSPSPLMLATNSFFNAEDPNYTPKAKYK